MPRRARLPSDSGIYHVMLRGINRQQIFYEKRDYLYFIELLKRFKEVSGYEIYAYCLMGNHIHLLIKENTESIGQSIKRIGAAFAAWYNPKYDRVGHIFQDRFKSEPVNDETYLFTVLRYILQNPVKGGLCCLPADYPYSNAVDYFSETSGFCNTDFIFSLFDAQGLRKYLTEINDDVCMDNESAPRRKVPDQLAREKIIEEFGSANPGIYDKRDRETFAASLRKLSAFGISIRQIANITGIPKGIIERYSK